MPWDRQCQRSLWGEQRNSRTWKGIAGRPSIFVGKTSVPPVKLMSSGERLEPESVRRYPISRNAGSGISTLWFSPFQE